MLLFQDRGDPLDPGKSSALWRLLSEGPGRWCWQLEGVEIKNKGVLLERWQAVRISKRI